jgi:hypothetical protein
LLAVVAPPSGHVFCVQRQRGLVWYAKYRTGTGRKIQKMLGPAWTRRGRPPAAYVTRSAAERWLCATLEQIRARTQPPMAGTRATFEAAAAEWLRHVEADRSRKPNTIRGYEILLRVHVLPEFEGQLLTEISTEQIERWVWGIQCSAATRAKAVALPRSAPHVRDDDDRAHEHPPRAGMDGSQRPAQHHALPALRAALDFPRVRREFASHPSRAFPRITPFPR